MSDVATRCLHFMQLAACRHQICHSETEMHGQMTIGSAAKARGTQRPGMWLSTFASEGESSGRPRCTWLGGETIPQLPQDIWLQGYIGFSNNLLFGVQARPKIQMSPNRPRPKAQEGDQRESPDRLARQDVSHLESMRSPPTAPSTALSNRPVEPT